MVTTGRNFADWPGRHPVQTEIRSGIVRAGLRLVLVVGALAALAESTAADAPQDYDAWYVGSIRDVPFSSLHTTKQRQADGTIRFTHETRSLVDLLGQRQELRKKFECVVSQSLEPISCHFESHGQSGAATARGHVEGREFVMSFERGTSRFERRIALTGKVIFSPCLADALAAQGDSQGPVSLNVITIGSWVSGSVTGQRLADADDLARWRVKGEAVSDHNGTWFLNSDGTLQRAEFSRSFVVKRGTAQEAARLKYLKHSDRDLLIFPVEQDLPFPERLRSMTVRLRWKDAPPEKLQLEDSRQRIVRQSHDENQHDVELRLGQPVDVQLPPPVPVLDPSFAPYLAQTHYIRPNDPAIRDQAQKWTAGSATTMVAVQRLSHEVWSYLDGGDLVAETLSGPEVLACRKGKCSEFTTLLASLARSVGVPTRVALGMRLVAGRWFGHMWCEVWVGQWIPVDATADEVGGSPALLKLTHSETVMGTQAARWAVAKSLEIKVVEVEQDPKLRSHLKTGIVRQCYTNADFACRITAPTPDWRLEDKSTPGVVTIRFEPPGDHKGGKPLVHFVAFGLPGKLDASTLVNGRRTLFASKYKNFEVLTDATETVGSMKGRRLVFRRQDSESNEKKIKTTEILWTHERSGYLLNLIAEESMHDAVLKQFEALLSSFERLPPTADETERR